MAPCAPDVTVSVMLLPREFVRGPHGPRRSRIRACHTCEALFRLPNLHSSRLPPTDRHLDNMVVMEGAGRRHPAAESRRFSRPVLTGARRFEMDGRTRGEA